MNKKDAFFLGLLAAVLAILAAPVLLRPWMVFGNFGDIYAYHFPLQHLTAAGIQAGQMPFWNPYIFSGLPHFANSQSAVFYPPAVLLRLLPLGYAFTLYITGHLALAGLGMYLLMRKSRLEPSLSCLFAAAFCLGPFIIYRIPEGIPTHVAALAYVPWCWLALRARRPGLLGLVWALQALSGHPQFALINAVGMGAAALLERSRWRLLRDMFREGFIGAVLCIIQLIPMAEFIGRSNRGAVPAEFAEAYSMPPAALSTLLWPAAAGDPLAGTFKSVPSVFFESHAIYAGWIPLALALYGLWAALGRKRRAPGAGTGWLLAALGAFLALGRFNPLIDWVQSLPVAGLSRVPARFGLLVVWGVLLAGAAAWRSLRSSGRIGARLKAAALLLVLLDVGLWAGRFIYAQDPAPYLAPNAAIVRHLAGRPLRFATGPDLANPNKAMLYRAMNLNGYDAFYLDSYLRYAARAQGGPAGDPSRTYIRRIGSDEMRRLGARYLLTSEDLPGEAVRISGKTRLYARAGGYPLAYLRDGLSTAGLWWNNPTAERWTLRGVVPESGDGRAILSVPRYPGWRAWLNGESVPIDLENGLVQSVALKNAAAGEDFRLDFRFTPTGWPWLCAAAISAWLTWFAFMSGLLKIERGRLSICSWG